MCVCGAITRAKLQMSLELLLAGIYNAMSDIDTHIHTHLNG